MMAPLGTIFGSGTNKPPKIDQHSLFTSIQVSVPVLEGNLQIYEPWRRKRNRPKECHVTLYANETSPFLVWYKLEKARNVHQQARASTSDIAFSPSSKPRCVIPVSRAKLAKTTGGSFELTDFASNLTFRFIATTIREAELWVRKLAEESLREANLDMRSICSSSSSFSSSTSSFPSPVATPSNSNMRVFSFSNASDHLPINSHRKSASFSDSTDTMTSYFYNDHSKDQTNSVKKTKTSKENDYVENADAFLEKRAATHVDPSKLSHERSNSKTFPRTQNSKSFAASRSNQCHVRAQPHLGLNVVLDKHRPELRNVISDTQTSNKPKPTLSNTSELPFSEYFLKVPDT